jgi:Glucose / Sorbosone dehydrogenase
MESLTGISRDEWLLLLVVAIAVVLIVAAFVDARPGLPVKRSSLLPLVAGSALLLLALVWLGDPLPTLFSRIATSARALAVAIAVAILALALCDFVLGRTTSLLRWMLLRFRLSEPASHDGALGASLALLLVAGVATLAAVNRGESVVAAPPSPWGGTQATGGARIVASYDVPGYVMGLVFRGKRDGYLTLAEGQILHFVLPDPPDGTMQLDPVADGLGNPRGMVIIGDRLFVSDVVGLPCQRPFQFCAGPNVGPSPEEGELTILKTARGRILAFDIAPDGTLRDQRVILDDLPAVSSLHTVNGLAVGPDGRLYAVIGNIDYLWETPHAIDRLDVPNLDLLGTVIRMNPDGRHVEVFARGIRNIYGLTFDDRGNLYGSDNDGYTVNGWRREEILRIRHGADYGYPTGRTPEGTAVPAEQPVWVEDTNGTAGIAWRGRFGLTPGLLVGSCGRIESFAMTDLGAGLAVRTRSDVTVILDQIPGCVTAIEPGPDQLALVGTFAGGSQPFPLLLVDLPG